MMVFLWVVVVGFAGFLWFGIKRHKEQQHVEEIKRLAEEYGLPWYSEDGIIEAFGEVDCSEGSCRCGECWPTLPQEPIRVKPQPGNGCGHHCIYKDEVINRHPYGGTQRDIIRTYSCGKKMMIPYPLEEEYRYRWDGRSWTEVIGTESYGPG